MPVNTELYDILEIPPTASEQDIKKAYKKQALKYHPDKGGDEKTFKKINRAYEVLSDPEKKKIYDANGKEDIPSHPDIFTNIFADMFSGAGGGFFNFFGGVPTQQNVMETRHIHKVTLEDLCTRKIIKLRITRNRECGCHQTVVCQECNGVGHKTKTVKLSEYMIQQFKEQCKCANGKIYRSCENCTEGLIQESKTLEMYLTPEMENGYRYVFKKEGDQIRGSQPFDFVVILSLEKHGTFNVENRDLTCKKTINLKEALCGFDFTLKHPSGEDIRIISSHVTKPGEIIVVSGKGIGGGSMIVNIDVSFPDSLSEEQKNALSSFL